MFVLTADPAEGGKVYEQLFRFAARSAAAALTMAREHGDFPGDATEYAAVAVTAWHVFKPTLAFEEVN